jgi:uncharacterized membrane protein
VDVLFPGLDALPNIHPLLVHFPIVLWPTALLFLTIAYLRGDDDLFRFGSWLLYMGVVAGGVAALFGWLASESIGHDQAGHGLVHDHRDLMAAAVVVSVFAAGAAHGSRGPLRRQRQLLPLGLLLVACLLSALGADRGGLLVYGHGVGVRGTPQAAASHTEPPDTTPAAAHGGHSH